MYIYHCILHAFKNVCGRRNSDLYHTRNRNNIHMIKSDLNSPHYEAALLFNKLPVQFRNEYKTSTIFKSKLKKVTYINSIINHIKPVHMNFCSTLCLKLFVSEPFFQIYELPFSVSAGLCLITGYCFSMFYC